MTTTNKSMILASLAIDPTTGKLEFSLAPLKVLLAQPKLLAALAEVQGLVMNAQPTVAVTVQPAASAQTPTPAQQPAASKPGSHAVGAVVSATVDADSYAGLVITAVRPKRAKDTGGFEYDVKDPSDGSEFFIYHSHITTPVAGGAVQQVAPAAPTAPAPVAPPAAPPAKPERRFQLGQLVHVAWTDGNTYEGSIDGYLKDGYRVKWSTNEMANALEAQVSPIVVEDPKAAPVAGKRTLSEAQKAAMAAGRAAKVAGRKA